MAKQPAKRRVSGAGGSGRVTPKGGPTAAERRGAPAPSARYTPPIPREMKVSPWWVPAVMFSLLGVGTLIILLNYVELLPTWGFLPDGTSNMWLLVGLVLILTGIIVATQWH
ncbi:MAG TPA: cell division protein CrgA [Acidimicrobiales bacterium]|nr:cell division protein CrgA [Acidimicrobiales bacterium]